MMPPIDMRRQAGGPDVWIARRNTLPLVVGSFILPVGASADPQGRSGLATLTGDALDTGTTTQSLRQIADRLEFVGATVRTRVTHDGTVLTFSTITRHLEEVLGVCADIWQHPTFPHADVERLREQRLMSLLQQKDRPGTIASHVFHRLVYGGGHPYGSDAGGDERGVRAITGSDLRSFHAARYTSPLPVIIAVGDITMERFAPLIARYVSPGSPSGAPEASPLPPPPPVPRRVVLVDKPGAPQSEIRVGLPALQRNSNDYIPAQVMNRILGGQFSSRLNANLRERRGLTYGAWSMFSALRSPGPFITGGAFHTEGTATAIGEIFSEMERMRAEGITGDEHTFAVESLAGSFALAFETAVQIAQALQAIPLYDLPIDYFATYPERLRAVSRDDVLDVARRYLTTESMTVVVVGDAAAIRSSLDGLGFGTVELFNPESSQ